MVYYAKQISIGEEHQQIIESESINLSRFVRQKLDELIQNRKLVNSQVIKNKKSVKNHNEVK